MPWDADAPYVPIPNFNSKLSLFTALKLEILIQNSPQISLLNAKAAELGNDLARRLNPEGVDTRMCASKNARPRRRADCKIPHWIHGLGEAAVKAAIVKCRTRNIQRMGLHVNPLRTAATRSLGSTTLRIEMAIEGFQASAQGFRMCRLEEGFHTLINDVLFSSPTNVVHHNPPSFEAQRGPASLLTLFPFSDRCGTPAKSTPFGVSVLIGTLSRVYPLWETTSSLAHSSVSGSDTICNDPDRSHVLTDLKRVYEGEVSYLYKECFLPLSPTDVGSHNPSPWG
ncbi:hypothetical protein SDJN02_27162, partial [Cucurbita argyrosperma subsp. argyrosperma]